MKQSECKAKLERERQESDKYWKKIIDQPHTYENLVCPHQIPTIGGHLDHGIFQMCWYCPKCGRSGCNTQADTIRAVDKVIVKQCDLEEG